MPGLKYMGPFDGHDLPGLINFLSEIRHVDKPILLHVKTKEGQRLRSNHQRADALPQPGRFQRHWWRLFRTAAGWR